MSHTHSALQAAERLTFMLAVYIARCGRDSGLDCTTCHTVLAHVATTWPAHEHDRAIGTHMQAVGSMIKEHPFPTRGTSYNRGTGATQNQHRSVNVIHTLFTNRCLVIARTHGQPVSSMFCEGEIGTCSVLCLLLAANQAGIISNPPCTVSCCDVARVRPCQLVVAIGVQSLVDSSNNLVAALGNGLAQAGPVVARVCQCRTLWMHDVSSARVHAYSTSTVHELCLNSFKLNQLTVT